MLGSPQFMGSSPPTSSNNSIWSKNNSNDTLLTTPSSNATIYTPAAIPSLGDPILFSPTLQQQQQQHDNQTLDSASKLEQSPKSNIMLTPPCTIRKQQQSRHNSIAVGYANASKPFSYADGYHYLINYVRQK